MELGVADETDSLGGLGQVDGDEVRLSKKIVEGHHAHTELGRTCRLNVGVVRNELDAEGAQPLRDEHTDATKTHDSDNLVGNFDAVVLRALPLAVGESRMRRHDVAS